eukprot:52853-Chlamydomonas_euryale.AAC.3
MAELMKLAFMTTLSVTPATPNPSPPPPPPASGHSPTCVLLCCRLVLPDSVLRGTRPLCLSPPCCPPHPGKVPAAGASCPLVLPGGIVFDVRPLPLFSPIPPGKVAPSCIFSPACPSRWRCLPRLARTRPWSCRGAP